ncbi:hypothetical protein HAZT_HAZT008613 [Hyalella azteca]|nr:hypothetical protein HAZT_HAZT008613 [Hyalella azteca]
MDELEQDVTSVRDVRARYGRDGDGSNVQLRYLWPSQQEMNLMKEYEKVFNPLSLPDTIAKAKHDKQEAIKFTVERQKALRENMKSLEKWKKAVRDKIRDNEEAARIAREKQARLIEEVRLMYGARIDPHDEKFQEILAQKEEEEKKTQKALKKQQKQQKLVEQMKKIAEQAKQKADEENQKNTPLPPTDQTSTNVV